MNPGDIPVDAIEWGRRRLSSLAHALHDAGINTLGDLTRTSAHELMALPRVYHASVWAIRDELARYGLRLRGEELTGEQNSSIAIVALMDSLPPVNTIWPDEQRAEWTAAALAAFELIYQR
jgi:hypothetical protein